MASLDWSARRLYAILDLGYVAPENALEVTQRLLDGGVDLVQLRAKNLPAATIERIGREMHARTRTAGVPLVINDYPEIARAIGAEGVHVGQDDLPVAHARRLAGSQCEFVGKSTHSVVQARAAVAEGADYIGFGPLFATPTKPAYEPIGLDDIAIVEAEVKLPVFCIGGIKLENLPRVLAAGAQRVVIVSGLLQAPDIASYARSAKSRLNNSPLQK